MVIKKTHTSTKVSSGVGDSNSRIRTLSTKRCWRTWQELICRESKNRRWEAVSTRYPSRLKFLPLVLLFKAQREHPLGQKKPHPRLCSSRARWPVAPNCYSQGTRKSQLFHRNHMLGTLDFTSSEHWAPFNFFFEHSLAHHCSKRVGDVNRGGVANLELDG